MWKTIDFEPNYEVSCLGEVRNKVTKKVKSLRYGRNGYLRVTLYPSGRTYSVHRLVALTFLVKETLRNVVNHKNGVKSDNRLENLELVTPKENVNHAYENGLNKHRNISGELNPASKLTKCDVLKIRNLAKDGVNWNVIAKEYGVQYNCIKRIVLNITWK